MLHFTAFSAGDAVLRVGRDLVLEEICLNGRNDTDEQLAELADCLLAHPDVVRIVSLAVNQLTDETGVKLARYLTASSTVQLLNLSFNWFSETTYLAVAAALRVNTSLQYLYLHDNQEVDKSHIDAAFVNALRLNPDRPARSEFSLYLDARYDFSRLKMAADQLGHPSLQMLLLLCSA